MLFKHFAAVCLGSLVLCSTANAEEATWISLNLDSAEAGSPPPTAPFALGNISQSLESVSVTESNKLQVVADAPGFSGKALRFIKGSADLRTPSATFVNKPGLAKSGKVKFSWESDIESFSAGEKFPGFEALLTFVLRDGNGSPFFTLYYLVNSSQSGGIFGSGSRKLGTWSLGEKQKVEVVVDLDAKTSLVTVDDVPLGEFETLAPTDGLRVVQFSDGAGLACYGSKFTATIANFKMTSL